MSSYLNIYGITKSDERLCLASFSRCTDMYQIIYENTTVSENDTDLTIDVLKSIDADINRQIDNITKRISLYEKNAAGNVEILDSILEESKYLDELKVLSHQLWLLMAIVSDGCSSWGGFKKFVMNIG